MTFALQLIVFQINDFCLITCMITILIVDDQKTIQHFLKISLEIEADFQIVGFANNGQEAIEKVAQLQPNIVIMDINMPIMDGLAATKVISELYKFTKVLIFSLYDDDRSLSNAIEAGAKGYLLKSTPSEEIVLAIRSAYQGYFQLGPGLLERYLYRFSINSLDNQEIKQKLNQTSELTDKTQNFNFVISKIVRDISKIESNLVLNRSLIYIIFVVNSLLIFLMVFYRV
jgi:DNA-binding NarL/FixJ family response regulator